MDKNNGYINRDKATGSASARKLLERTPESSYIAQWTELIVKEKEESKFQSERSLVIFRLADEWFALPTAVFSEVSPVRVVHRIPHRTNEVICGVVNVKGRLLLCVNLHYLLETKFTKGEGRLEKMERMLSIQSDGEEWIFSVDELYGIYHTMGEPLENVPVTVEKSKANYLKGMLQWDKRSVGVIDEELLFYSLRKNFF